MKTCRLELISGGRKEAIGSLQMRAHSFAKRVPILNFRDALDSYQLCGGEFTVSFEGYPSLGTGRFFASSETIRARLHLEPEDSATFRLPGVGACLEDLRDVYDQPVDGIRFEKALEHHRIREFVCGIVYLASVLDGSELGPDGRKVQACAPEFATRMSAWYQAACRALKNHDDPTQLLEAYADLQLNLLYAPRWRDTIEQLHKELTPDRVADVVKEWRESIVRDRFGNPGSELSERSGGRELTRVTQRYFQAFDLDGDADG